MKDRFRQVADVTASIVGSSERFVASLTLTAVWLALGPVFDFSNTWQLTMNTLALADDVSRGLSPADTQKPRYRGTAVEAPTS